MTPQEIMNGLKDKNRMLTQKNDELVDLNEKYAQAKRAYAIALATKLLQLKDNGVAATISQQLAKGDESVAEKRYKRDVAQGVYWACKDAVEAIKIQIDSYRSLLTWQREELHRS